MSTSHLQNLLVAYTATATGKDALNLGAALARTTGAHLHIVTVLPEDDAYAAVYPSDRGHVPIIQKQVRGWLEEARASLPEDIHSTIHTVSDSSDAAGLLAAAQRLHCEGIVLGGRRGGILRRFKLGTTANTLLHSSPVPVILAPAGYNNQQHLSRITAMFGPRPGAKDVISRALTAAKTHTLPLRLVSLVFVDRDDHPIEVNESTPAGALIDQVETFGNEQLAVQAADLVANKQASTVVATGKSVADAVGELAWLEDELVLVGSSRLATANRIFLGSTASRMLRAVSVPMMIIPAGTQQQPSRTSSRTI